MNRSDSPSDYNSYLGRDLSTLIILSSLTPNKSYSTYEIIKNIKIKTQNKISFRAGTIYPHMVKLEEEGLIQREIEDTTSRSPGVTRQKSVYSLTQEGLKILTEKRKDWEDLYRIITQIIKEGI